MLSFRLQSTDKKKTFRVSPWYYLDSLVCFGAVIVCIVLFMAYSYMIYAFALFCGIFLAVRTFRDKYIKGTKRSAGNRAVVGLIRLTVYAAAFITVSLPFAARESYNTKFYPVQRFLCLSSHSDSDDEEFLFLPEEIPEGVTGYKSEFVPSVLQAEGYVKVSFYTSKEQLEKYEKIAVSMGAVKCPDEKKSAYENIIKSSGENIENASVYVFPHERRRPVYIICPESGFFMLYR